MSIKINRKEILNIYYAIALLPVIWPIGITKAYLPALGDFITSKGLIISIILSIIISRLSPKVLVNKLNLVITALFGVFIISTLVNNQNLVVDYLKTFCGVFCLVTCFVFSCYDNSTDQFINVYINIMNCFLIMALISQVIHPEGVATSFYMNIGGDYASQSTVYFWGHKNYYGYYLVPYIFFVFLQIDLFASRYNKIKGYIGIGICILLVILTGSATSLIEIVTIIGLKIVLSNRKINLLIKISWIYLIYFILFMIMVVFRLGEGITIWISAIFHKSSVLTGRTEIWRTAIELIQKKVILGYGCDRVVPHVGYYWYAHNLILDILIQGGFLALFIFGILVYYSCKKMNNVSASNKIVASILAFAASIMVSQLVESCVKSNPFMYLIFYVSFFVEFIPKSISEKQEVN